MTLWSASPLSTLPLVSLYSNNGEESLFYRRDLSMAVCVASGRADRPCPLGTPLGGSRSRQPCPSARFGDRDDLTNARAPRITSLKRPGLATSPGPAHCTQVPGTWQP